MERCSDLQEVYQTGGRYFFLIRMMLQVYIYIYAEYIYIYIHIQNSTPMYAKYTDRNRIYIYNNRYPGCSNKHHNENPFDVFSRSDPDVGEHDQTPQGGGQS